MDKETELADCNDVNNGINRARRCGRRWAADSVARFIEFHILLADGRFRKCLLLVYSLASMSYTAWAGVARSVCSTVQVFGQPLRGRPITWSVGLINI